MKRKYGIVAMMVAGIGFLGGCGSDEAEPTPATEQPAAAEKSVEAPSQPAQEAVAKSPDAVDGVAEDITLPSGVVIRDIIVGDGEEVQPGGTVEVHCVGTLTSGKEFWSSYSAAGGGKPFTSPLKALIPAWQEGIPGMKVGGKRQLTCPPETAYGSEEKRDPDGSVAIPANSTLIFVIELIDVK